MATTQNNTNQWIETAGIFAAIMNGQTCLDADLQYELHTQISDLQPGDAITAIARSAMAVTKVYHKASPAMAILDEECQLNLKNATKNNDDIVALMKNLQTFNELLKINISFLRSKDTVAAALLRILATQADAHGMVIEEICRMSGVGTITEGRAFLPRYVEQDDFHEDHPA